jgi:hypothetical protein
METNIKLEKLTEELNYYKVDYESKMSENKITSIKYCIDEFSRFVKQKGFILENKDLVCIARSLDFEIKIFPQFDYKKEPRQGKGIKIEKIEFSNNKKTEFLIGIYNNTPLPTPDLKRIFENPYKNMSIEEIEILEKEKDLKYYKEYISDIETREHTEYSAVNLTTGTELGLEKEIQKFYERIVE